MSGRCVDQPLSWLALEAWALGELEGAAAGRVSAHLDRCPACREALDTIRADARDLPPLPAPRERWRAPRWFWLGGGLAAAAAAALLAVRALAPGGGVKGGELAVELVRERAGAITPAPEGFAAGDRFKVLVTCAPGDAVIEVVVWQADAPGEPPRPAMPLPPARLACGNRVAVPGAFELSGTTPARVCARVRAEESCVSLDPSPRSPQY